MVALHRWRRRKGGSGNSKNQKIFLLVLQSQQDLQQILKEKERKEIAQTKNHIILRRPKARLIS